MALMLLSGHAVAQNLPVIETVQDTYLFNGSVTNYVFLPGVSDGDGNVETVEITATSDNEAIVVVNGIEYDPANTFAVMELEVIGSDGSATITVQLTDNDGTTTEDFLVTVGPYTNTGAVFEIHDIVFWQEVIPLSGNPVFDTIVPTSQPPYDDINYDKLDITVNAVKDDFFTGLTKGYIIPKITGNYRFSILTENDGGVWISETSSFADADPVVVRSDNHGRIGTADAQNSFMWHSDQIELEAGHVYAFYAVQWIVHATYGGALWEGPGFDRQYIGGDYIFTDYDNVKPTTPTGVSLDILGVDEVRISWGASTDNKALAGYNIYLNGILYNDEPVNGTNSFIGGLTSGTTNSVAVVAVDEVGNESAPADILTFTTYNEDNDPPSPPTDAALLTQSGLAMEISWSGATDAESAVNAYYIYVDDILFNAEPLYATTLVIDGLVPETSYDITIEAIDAGGNTSAKSAVFAFFTSTFDPLGNNLGVKSGRFSFDLDPFSYSHGIGVNPDYKGGAVFNSTHAELLEELKPGGIRWGALTANPLNFADYIGTGKSVTIGRFMNLCNQYDAWTVFCCGVKNSTDWMSNPNTFLNFLEYLAGPAGTTYGDKRIAEGYTESLLDASPGLIFEFGNEVWGGVSHNAEIWAQESDAYTNWCIEMANLMKSSPYYDSEKIKLAYSARNPDPGMSYQVNERVLEGDNGEVELLAFSGYLGGNLNYDPAIPAGDSELDYYKNAMERVARNIAGMDHYAEYTLEGNGGVKSSYLYESNTTTPAYNARHGQAIVSIDYYLTAIEHGSIVPTIFHLTGGQWRITEPTDGYRRLSLFKAASLVNTYARGYTLHSDYETTDQIFTSQGYAIDYDPVGCHAYYNNGNYSLILVSRDFTSDHVVQVDIPDELGFTSAGRMYSLNSDGYSSRDGFVDSTDVSLEDGMLVTVPKYGMVLIRFQGDQITMDEVPGIGEYEYVAMTSVAIEYETLEIDTDRGSLDLTATYEPANALANNVVWTIYDNTIGVKEVLYPNAVNLRASGKCDGNGTIRVRASAPGDSTIYDEVTITITNQVGPECTGVAELTGEMINVYPNPATDRIQFTMPSVFDFELKLYSSLGQLVKEASGYSGQLELRTGELGNGIYIAEISSGKQVHHKRIVIGR